MNKDIGERIIEFLVSQKKSFGKIFCGTREVANAVGLTIYQVRGCLNELQSSHVVEKVNYGPGKPGLWRLL